MPTYEYHCDACGNHFDEFQGINDPTLKKCPKCKKQKLRRIFGTGAAIIFKGSGFYETDYRSDAYKASAKADKESSGGDKKESGDKKPTTGSTETKSESKPAETKNSSKSKTAKSDD
jgi:putative FmdB family regulatory protein